MRLLALSTGYAIPQADFDATIHSVFRAATNLRSADSDLLLTLVTAGEADLPQGVRLDTPDGFSFEQLSVGGGAFCRNYILGFENSALEVDFSQARRWQCDLPAMRIDITSPVVVEAWKCAWQALNDRQVRLGAEIVAQTLLQSSGNTESAILWRMREAVRALVSATRNRQLDPSILTRLIGLGTGLTPCGDDFLIGYLAGLWCAVRDSIEREQFVLKLGQAIIQLTGETNDISRTYLFHAAHGQVSGRLDVLAGAISKAESPRQLLPAAESAMGSGHTSGMDAVTGLLFGLAVWEIDVLERTFGKQ